MKKRYLIVLLAVMISGYAQKKESQTQDIAILEQKMASKKMNLRVNPNTQNYDITYHELRFTVNPASYYISGSCNYDFYCIIGSFNSYF